MTPTHGRVITSPVKIGIDSDESDVTTIIDKGMPLLAHGVHTVQSCPAETTTWQVQPL
jgi:hypothetical protein